MLLWCAYRHAGAALLFAILAIVLTWPLALHLETHVPGVDASDNIALMWSFGWMRDVLADDTLRLFETTAIFHPVGTGLAMHTHAFASAFAGATLFGGQSIVGAQNAVLLASVALNGYVTWMLAWRMTGHTSGAFIAGLYFAAAPYFAGHLLGHFNLIPAWLLPLFALLWLGALERRSTWRAAAAGLILAATLWTDYYYAAYALAFVAITLGVRWVQVTWAVQPARERRWPDHALLGLVALLVALVLTIRVSGGGVFFVGDLRISATTGLPPLTAMWALMVVRAWRRWRPQPRVRAAPSARPVHDAALLSVAGVAAIVGAWPILREAAGLWQSGDYVTPPGFLRSAAGGVDPLGFVAGNPFHPLWGHLTRAFYDAASIDVVESTAWFGLAGLCVLIVTRGFTRGFTRLTADDAGASTRLWIVTAVVFLVWSLGPYLRVFGENTGLYLPAALLRLLPVANNLRIPGRAVVMVYLSGAMLIGIVVATMPAFRQRWRTTLLGSLIFVDFLAVPLPLVALPRPAVYQRLAAMPPGAVLDLPMGVRDGYGEHGALDHRTLFFQSIHGHPMVGGFVARMSDSLERTHLESALFGPLLVLSEGGTPAPEAIDRLRRDGRRLLAESSVRYVVLTRDAPVAVRDLVAAWALRPVLADEERDVFQAE